VCALRSLRADADFVERPETGLSLDARPNAQLSEWTSPAEPVVDASEWPPRRG
jgi:hypothetical protein